MPSRSFPKPVRLLKHADFERVYKSGRRHFSGNMTVFSLRRESGGNAGPSGGQDSIGYPEAQRQRRIMKAATVSGSPENVAQARVGFTVGRVLGPAVVRNRIRRRVREAVRQHLLLVTAPVDVVINPKKSALTAPFTELAEEVKRAFEKIECEQRKADA